MRKLDADVLDVLSNTTCEADLAILPPKLDRKLYLKVNPVLEACGGKWDRKRKGHVFGSDAALALEAVILTGEYVKPEDFGFFPTPKPLAVRVVELAEIQKGMKVLEPSAGIGSIAIFLAQVVDDEDLHLIELQPKNCDSLRKLFANVTCADFLTIQPEAKYDRVVMNPPFAPRQLDIDHVTHAFKFVKPGGRLVSIMAAGIKFRTNKKTAELRTLFDEHGAVMEDNPEKSFVVSGTSVNTVTVVINKK